jgi:chromosome segregation protein
MSAPARLLALRLQGFKSFAERTVVEFGPGISAIVGPNGSGKSNLADALRWALGEQGRALRSRKAEDVIWAGSERRAAVGMADVTIMLDNSDGLLPVEYSAIELGRRLFRSGENDYLLNRQRVRLRDLIDLLDGANLADNAFLFIGQGMVDQALSLRPEERRPLFEEVAGVRRHERRRRRAEEQLTESEANLARVEDILAELRPQAKRLAVQAEQQASRETAGAELADALLLAAHARWHETSARLSAAERTRGAGADAVARATQQARDAEAVVATIGRELSGRVAHETELRSRHEQARSALTALQLREARLASEIEANERDQARLRLEREAAEADLSVQRRGLAVGLPPRDMDLEESLGAAERSLAEALAEVAGLRAADRARGAELTAMKRAEQARQAERDAAHRRLAEVERRATDEAARLAAVREREEELLERRASVVAALSEAETAESRATEVREEARVRAEGREAESRAAAERAATASAALGALIARAADLEARLRDDDAQGIARIAREHGGRSLDEDLVVDSDLVAAVEAALGPAGRGVLVRRAVLESLAAERGTAVVSEVAAAAERNRADAAFVTALNERGGGSLTDAVVRDPSGGVRALLMRAAWLPTLADCLAVQAEMPPGWILVTRDGGVVLNGPAVSFGRAEGAIRRKSGLEAVNAERSQGERKRDLARTAESTAGQAAVEARDALEVAREAENAARAKRRAAEDAVRVAERELEAVVRERAWHEAQIERLDAEVTRAREALPPDPVSTPASTGTSRASDGASAWEERVRELRAHRDRLAAQKAASDAGRHEAEARRARSEAATALDEERISRADREQAALLARNAELANERDALRTDIADAQRLEAEARTELDGLLAAATADRSRLAEAEAVASTARTRLHEAEERLRAADRQELEARLGVDAMREQLLVELASLGELGISRLRETAGEEDAVDAGDLESADESDAAVFERLLDVIGPTWASTQPAGEPPPAGRLTYLRRRFHELGASNPFAVEEYAELRERLEGLQTQEQDLRAAIESTRSLIGELNALIGDQFRTTFRALEAAFDRRFNQLFGGGYARLSLTDPGDLAQTGVEIVARPPGKKAQGLAMLSGGERALTAVALLFAMLEVRPVPFCVLDEVDAALDEANVGRFSAALRGLADQTQFIVITHNRGTIEIADALYGVTVGEDSVSRVISLRLDEAQAIAERQAPGSDQPASPDEPASPDQPAASPASVG